MTAKTGERKDQILQTLAQMLETPAGEKVTTAALAARQGSEAALYRHFKGKAEMFEGLIEFIEQALSGSSTGSPARRRAAGARSQGIIACCSLSRRKPRHDGVLIGDALVNEDGRCSSASQPAADRLEAALKRRCASGEPEGDRGGSGRHRPGQLIMSFVTGRWHQFAKSGFSAIRPSCGEAVAQLMEGVIA